MKLSTAVIIILLLFSGMATGISCNRNTNNPVENVVYYYPEKNTYYDSLQSKYYYSLNGAKSWDSMSYEGAGYGAALGPKVAIERTGENVWLANESNRKAYNGVLLNIINPRTISISKSDSVNKLKPKVTFKPKPVVIEKEVPVEKGLKKFFNKLFGKKKKPVEGNNNQ